MNWFSFMSKPTLSQPNPPLSAPESVFSKAVIKVKSIENTMKEILFEIAYNHSFANNCTRTYYPLRIYCDGRGGEGPVTSIFENLKSVYVELMTCRQLTAEKFNKFHTTYTSLIEEIKKNKTQGLDYSEYSCVTKFCYEYLRCLRKHTKDFTPEMLQAFNPAVPFKTSDEAIKYLENQVNTFIESLDWVFLNNRVKKLENYRQYFSSVETGVILTCMDLVAKISGSQNHKNLGSSNSQLDSFSDKTEQACEKQIEDILAKRKGLMGEQEWIDDFDNECEDSTSSANPIEQKKYTTAQKIVLHDSTTSKEGSQLPYSLQLKALEILYQKNNDANIYAQALKLSNYLLGLTDPFDNESVSKF